MNEELDHGQVRQGLAQLAVAAAELGAGQPVSTGALRAAYHATRPAGHALANARSPDLAFLGTLYALGGTALLSAPRLIVLQGAPRMPPEVWPLHGGVEVKVPRSEEAPADVLAIALGLDVEAQKMRAALGANSAPGAAIAERVLGLPGGSLVASFGDETSAAQALAALLSAPVERVVHAAVPDASLRPETAASMDEGPLFILAGATERFHDVVSPWFRRLDASLKALVDADAEHDGCYAALPALLQVDPGVHDERQRAEAADGIVPCGDYLVIHHRDLDPAQADPRAAPALQDLKKSRATTVLVGRRSAALRKALHDHAQPARAVVLLAEAFAPAGTLLMPDVLVHPDGPSFKEMPNTLGLERGRIAHASMHVPSLGLAPRHAPGLPTTASANALLWPLLSSVSAARAEAVLPAHVRLAAGLTSPMSADCSALVFHCLARMATAAQTDSPRK